MLRQVVQRLAMLMTLLTMARPHEATPAFYRYSTPNTPPIAPDAHLLVTGSVFDRSNIQLSLSSAHRQRHTWLDSLPICSQPHDTAHLPYLLSCFRYFPAGRSCIHTHTSKLTCAISQTCHRLGVIAQSINQFTFYVFGTHQGSQQTITGGTIYTKH